MTQPASTPAERSLLGSGAVMAAGTFVSRTSGYVRNFLLVAAIGNGLHADLFNIANTIPNMLYILLAGGVFNAVLVPQLVRSQKNDADGGRAYTNRVITLAGLFLAAVSLLLVVAAPLLMHLFLSGRYYHSGMGAQRDAVIAFARLCLPQVFFYGMFVLVGQVLNARGSFGPMMWAPIANNVVSVAVLLGYLVAFGPASGAQLRGGYSTGQELLLGLGSTAGIVLQFLVLLPYARRAGVRFRPRLDLRGSGLGHTLRLGVWTVLFVIANQVAYTVVVHVASNGSAAGGTGYTVYSNSFLLVMVPHSVITVSLATAVLPRLSRYAADGDLPALGRSVAGTVRSTYAVVAPVLVLVPVVALEAAHVVFGLGAGATSYSHYVPTLSLFTVGLFFFTLHYLLLRGFYAIEQNRRVFFIQCAVSATNIVIAVVITRHCPAEQTAPRLVIAYTAAYAVGAVVSYVQLTRQLGGLEGSRTVRFVVRLVIAVAVTAGVGLLVRLGVEGMIPGHSWLRAVVVAALVGGIGLAAYVVAARAMRIEEVDDVLHTITRGRVPRGVSGATSDRGRRRRHG